MNVAYRAARAQGAVTRSLYKRFMNRIVNSPIKQDRKIPAEVYSFSGEDYLPEQVASIRSFIKCVGIPDRFTIISDGSYSQKSCDVLRQCSPCVSVVEWKDFVVELPDYVKNFANLNPMGKKLGLLLSMPVKTITIYTDCDILFFPGASELIELAASNKNNYWYLPDCLRSLDQSILTDASEADNPINAGFMLLRKPLVWDDSLERLANYEGSPVSQTEQTIVHLTMHQNKAVPLDRDRFVLSVSDQFVYRDHFSTQPIALRHYVNNVRHKFWQHVGVS